MKFCYLILLFITKSDTFLLTNRIIHSLKPVISNIKMENHPFKNYREILTVIPNFQSNIIINNWLSCVNEINSTDLSYQKRGIYDFKVTMSLLKEYNNTLILAWTPDIHLNERPVVYLIIGRFFKDCIEIHRIAQNPYYKYHLQITLSDLFYELEKFKNFNNANISLDFNKLYEHDVRYKLSRLFHFDF